jgi:hypothetical protein
MEPVQLPEIEVIRKFQEGATYQQLAEEYKVSRGTIWRIIKRHNALRYQELRILRAERAQLGIIWYIARDTLQDRWFPVFYDDRYFWAAINRARRLRRHIKEGTLPPRRGG